MLTGLCSTQLGYIGISSSLLNLMPVLYDDETINLQAFLSRKPFSRFCSDTHESTICGVLCAQCSALETKGDLRLYTCTLDVLSDAEIIHIL